MYLFKFAKMKERLLLLNQFNHFDIILILDVPQYLVSWHILSTFKIE